MRVLLILTCAAICRAQAPSVPKPVFPDDSQDPKQAGGAEMLESVCPGYVVVGKEIRCNIPCPKDTGFENEVFEWDLARVTRGHFLSPESDDAVLAMLGCEPHSENFGGTILLTKRSQRWTMLWYKAGVPTESCHEARLPNEREILVCIGGYGGQGSVSTVLYVEDLLSPSATLMAGHAGAFFEVLDTVATCGWNLEDESKPFPLTRNYIERVDFRTRPDGSIQGLTVFARRGERSMTEAEVEACSDEQSLNKPHKGINFSPPTKPYRVDFTFDGRTFRRVTATKPSK